MSDLSTTIKKVEEDFWQANVDRDVDYYEKVLANNAQVITGFGAIGKEAVLASVAHAPIDYLNFKLTDQKVEKLQDAALITYLAVYEAKIGGKNLPFTAFCSTLYVKHGDDWQAMLHQETPKLEA